MFQEHLTSVILFRSELDGGNHDTVATSVRGRIQSLFYHHVRLPFYMTENKKTPSYDYDYSFLHDTIHIFELEHNLTLSLNFNYTPVKFRDCTARWWHFHIDQKVSTERRTTYIHLEKSSKSPLCWFLNEPVPRTTFCHYDTHTTRKHRLTKWNISSWRCHGWYQ